MPNMPRKQQRSHKRIQQRASPNREVYNSRRWKAVARLHKSLNPLCVECEKQGIIMPVEVTDHILPINDGGAAWSMGNMQSLCYRHHAIKSGKEGQAISSGRGEGKRENTGGEGGYNL